MKTKAQAIAFFAALQRAMLTHGVSSIEAGDGRILLFDKNGRRCCSFEELNTAGEHISDCVGAGWP